MTHEEAAAKRDDGMQRVSRPDWLAEAADVFPLFLKVWPTPAFLAEDFVTWAVPRFLSEPHDRRAFGVVIMRAARAGLIRRRGYACAKTSNLSPKVLWEKA
jgi:hypothetical protein